MSQLPRRFGEMGSERRLLGPSNKSLKQTQIEPRPGSSEKASFPDVGRQENRARGEPSSGSFFYVETLQLRVSVISKLSDHSVNCQELVISF